MLDLKRDSNASRKYALELISETRLGASKPIMTPIDTNVKLTIKESDHLNQAENKKSGTLADQITYQRLIGKLLYITTTRPSEILKEDAPSEAGAF